MLRNRIFDSQFFRHIHIVGIGGIGMSAIAEILVEQGYKVTGSDIKESDNTKRLVKAGVDIILEHCPKNVFGSDAVVVSGAIGKENTEVLEANTLHIPVISRGEMLWEFIRSKMGIAVSGTHGKTTTTGLIINIFETAGFDPSYVIGGILNETKRNARLGIGRHFIVEADESDRTFLKLQPVIAVLTNIDKDHLSNYEDSFEVLKKAFREFVDGVPLFGRVVLCIDDEPARSLLNGLDRPVVTYGLSEEAAYQAEDILLGENQTRFVVKRPSPHSKLEITLSISGVHNVRNALAAIAVATEEGISDSSIKKGLVSFGGVERRFEIKEISFDSKSITLVDDYGHHPAEMTCSIDTVKRVWPNRRVIMVFQPHRYTRNRDLLLEFATVLSQTDVLILCDVFAAGETPIEGADSEALGTLIRKINRTEVFLVSGPREAVQVAKSQVVKGDILIVQGAGDVSVVSAHFKENKHE